MAYGIYSNADLITVIMMHDDVVPLKQVEDRRPPCRIVVEMWDILPSRAVGYRESAGGTLNA
eukprot:4709810-Pleurochrysis_carterae.AAC.2